MTPRKTGCRPDGEQVTAIAFDYGGHAVTFRASPEPEARR